MRPVWNALGRALQRTPSFPAMIALPSSATDRTIDRVSTEAFLNSFSGAKLLATPRSWGKAARRIL
jgi:hypothetical protein